MKKIYYVLAVAFLVLCFIGNTSAQLTIVKAVIVDSDKDGIADALELKFNQPIDFSESNDEDDDWWLSNNSDMSDSLVAADFTTIVEYIADASAADDEYARVEFNNLGESLLANDTKSPFYYLYVQTNGPNDAVVSLDHSDTLRTMIIPVLAEDYSPPKIDTYFKTEIGTGAKLGINDTIKFKVNLFTSETGVTISPDKYNGRNLNWTSSNDSTFYGEYVVTEGDPDQIIGLDLTGVTAEDSDGNISSPVDFDILKSIDANRPDINSIFYSPGDGQTLGIDSVLTITIKAKNLETGLSLNTAIVNNIDVSGSFTENGSGYYTVQYSVQSGHESINDDAEAIPVVFEFFDGTNYTLPNFRDSTILASPGIDKTVPVISNITLSPSTGLLGIGDTIVFTVDAGEPGLKAATVSINGKSLITKFTEIGSGNYEIEYVIKSLDTNINDLTESIPISIILKDAAGNPSNNFNLLAIGDCPGIDASRPSISSVSFLPNSGVRAINELITVTITASESNLSADSILLNGKSFAIAGTGPSYTIDYIIQEGDNDILDSSPIPIYFTLTDGANISLPFTTSGITAINCPGIDANRPGIKTVNFSPGDGNTLGIDSVLTIIIEADDLEESLTAPTKLVNGVTGIFSEIGSGFYTLEYTVQNGHGSINDATQAIPINLIFDDGENLTSPAFTGSTILSTPGIDDTAPSISVSLLPSSGMQAIDDTIIFTVTAAENELKASTILINGKNLINKFSAIGSNKYEIEYVIKSGDPYINDITEAIPINIILNDAAGNVSNSINSIAILNCPGIDASRPSISNVDVNAATMLYGQTYTITIEVNFDDVDTWSLVSGTIAGFNLFNVSKFDDDTYNADFTVGVLGYDILPDDSYNIANLVLSDPAGNLSSPYSATITQAADPIYTILPTAKVKGTHHVCDGKSAELLFQLTGSAPWDIELFDGTVSIPVSGINESPYIYSVQVNDVNILTEPDTVIYKITQVTDINGNIKLMTGLDSAIVFIHEVPVVDITDPAGDQTYNINADQDTLVGNPVGGIFSGDGIVPSNNTFLPSAAGLGYHNIVYTYTIPSSGCYDSDTVEFEVIESNADITFDNGDDNWRCDYETTFSVSAEVITNPTIVGTLQLYAAPAAITSTGNNTAEIDIQQLSAGTYEVTYEYIDGTFTSVTRSFTVESVSNSIDFTNVSDKCEDYDTIFVDAFNLIPSGGTGEFIFSGLGAAFEYESGSNNNSGYLLPGQISPGSYELKYIYTTPNSCQSNPVIKYFDINALPNVSFTMNAVYNIDQGSSVINGSPLGATGVFTPLSFMSNNGDGTADFDPADAGIGMHWVKYTFENANGCVNADSTEIEINKALGEITSSSGTFQFCFFGSTTVTFTGTPNPTDGSPGNFYIDDILITPESNNKILFNPQEYNAGDHVVKFEYTNALTSYVVFKTINVDIIGNISFTGLESNYCENEDIEVELTAIYTGQEGVMKFTGIGITDDVVDGLGYFNPSNANLGDNPITYTFTRDYSACKKVYDETVKINKTPKVAFYPNERCIVNTGDSVRFISDTLLSDTIVAWNWIFKNSRTSTESSPSFPITPGYNTTSLTLETKQGCTNKVDSSFYIGTRVELEFTFENECHGETVLFKLLTSSDPTDTIRVNWDFGGAGISDLSDVKNPTCKYTYPGGYNVIYEEYLKSCGRIADTVKINIRPSFDLGAQEYIEPFEDNSDITGWVIEDYVDGANNTWQWGKPVGDKINAAASGTNAFVTNLDGNYFNSEKGMITSPCFDFSGMQRPMMKMDFISFTEEDRDGVVMQYTKQDGEWATIGVPNEGINWYNSYVIAGAPAGQQLGWTGEITGDDNSGWQTAMYRLDELRGRAGVRFRIVFGSNGDGTDEGFAFDNIQFSERKRIVLLENFTNSSDDAANNTQVNIINPILIKDTLDVINLNYHASFPILNDFNSFYPSGPSARALFYGVSDVPYSILDGGERQFDYLLGHNLTETDVHKRVLIDPRFEISVKQDIQSNNFVVSSTVKALDEISGQNIIVYLAIVEKTVVVGSNIYHNVLRTMLPDAAGILVEREWIEGDSVNIYQTWNISEAVNEDSLITIVFVQDKNSKEIYQTGFTGEYSTITAINKIMDQITGTDYVVYPNPMSEILSVKFIKPLSFDLDLKIYNSIGILVKSAKLFKGSNLIEINSSNLPLGVYNLRLTNNDKLFGNTKIIKSE